MSRMPRDTYLAVLLWTPTIVCASLVVLGGFAFKSSRWAGNMTWHDGVKPWVGWAVLGGMAILLLSRIAIWQRRSIIPALFAVYLFVRAGREASEYRERLETSFIDHPLYTGQNLALGLDVVPTVATAGMICTALIIIAEFIRMGNGRRGMSRAVAPPANASR